MFGKTTNEANRGKRIERNHSRMPSTGNPAMSHSAKHAGQLTDTNHLCNHTAQGNSGQIESDPTI
jgi:hypothetical protein